MTARNTSSSYGSVAKSFHWTISLLVIVLLCVGALMGDIGSKPLKFQVYTIHKLTGLLVLMLMASRLIWKLINASPTLPAGTRAWEITAKRVVHFMLYAVIIAMPLTGWIMSTAAGKSPSFFGLFAIPLPGIPADKPLAYLFASFHTILAYTIVVFLVVHVGAALK